MNVAIFICYVGLLSAISQTVLLSNLIKKIGAKYSITIGLVAQLIQLLSYGLTDNEIVVWLGGTGIAVSSITYAAISAHASILTDKDKQVRIRKLKTYF